MSNNKIKGLEGLKSFGDLSQEEKTAFYTKYEDLLSPFNGDPIKYSKAAHTIYNNRRFIDRFGQEAFNRYDADTRETIYRDSIVNDAIQVYKDDNRFPEIMNMTTSGKIKLLESNYLTDAELQEEATKKQDYVDNVNSNKFRNSMYDFARGTNPVTASEVGIFTLEQDLNTAVETSNEQLIEGRNSQLDAYIAKDNLEKSNQVAPEASEYLSSWQNAINSGNLTVDELNTEFDKYIGDSPYYKAFKDTEVLSNFTSSNKMKFLSEFVAIAEKFGIESAYSVINTKLQDYISDNQSAGEWAWNTTKKVALKGVSNLANKVMALEAAFKAFDQEELSLFLQGKDAEGNELPWYNNPLYWQGVDQFNTIDANEINNIRFNGGISPYNNITRAGEEMEFFSWSTLNEAIGQLGYLWSEQVASWAMGRAGAGLGKVMPKLTASKFGRVTGTIADVGQSVMGMAEAEGLSSFQETLQQANEIIDKQIDIETRTKIEEFSKTSEYNDALNTTINNIKKLNADRNVLYTDEDLRNQAAEVLNQQLYKKFKTEIADQHSQDRIEAGKSATKAYMTTASVFAVKEAATNSLFQKFLYNKGTRQTLGDNGPKFSVTKNTDGTYSTHISKWEKYGKPIATQPLVEFGEEVTDNIVNNFGQGFGLNDYLDYHNKKYNPEAYVEATDNTLGNLVAGINKAENSLLKKDAYYEGFIGAVSGVGGSVSSIIRNIYGAKYLDANTKLVNNILKNHGVALQDMAGIVSTLHDADVAIENQDLLKSIDTKQRMAFDLVNAMAELEHSDVGRYTEVYQDTIKTLQNLVNDNTSEKELNELVTQFLGQPENKSIADKPNARELAMSLLKDNAKKFLDTKKEVDDFYTTLDKSPNSGILSPETKQELAYLKIMRKNWEDRVKSINEALEVSGNGQFSVYAEYGSKEAYERKKNSIIESINHLKRQLNETQEKIKDKGVKRVNKLALKLKEKAIKEAIKKTEANLEQVKGHNSIFSTTAKGTVESSTVLSKTEILNLPAEQRAWILSSENLKDYSEAQQVVIKELKEELAVKDPSLLNQIQDAAILENRITEANTAFSRIMDNPLEAVYYINALKQQRNSQLAELYTQKYNSNIEKLLDKSGDEAIVLAKALPSVAIKDYIKKHPERAELLSGIQETVELKEDVYDIIDSLGIDGRAADLTKSTITDIVNLSNTKEEAINEMENIIDSPQVTEENKQLFDTILSRLEALNYQRNATKLANREAEKKRKEEKKAQEAEAERRREEAERRAIQEFENNQLQVSEDDGKVSKDGENLEELMEDANINSDGSNVQETIEVDESKTGSEDSFVSVEGDVILDNIDTVDRINSPTLAEQVEDNPLIRDAAVVTPSTNTVDSVEDTILVGNSMYRYDTKALREDKYQVERQGIKEEDSMNKFFSWMESAGIKFQEIIDNELSEVLKANSKIQFLLVNPQDNATNDVDMSDHVLEVVEYTPEVAEIHEKSRGGVITANNKRWLVVGTLGFSTKSQEQGEAYRRLKYELKKARFKYFNENTTERFYVDSYYSTKVASIDAGSIVRKLTNDTEVKLRSISELLNESSRNPKSLKLKDLKWGIQYGGEFKTVRVSERDRIHTPKDVSGNVGNTFLLVETANGDYIPVALKVAQYSEIKKDSRLKEHIDNLLIELTSPNHTDRYIAIKKLVQWLYLKEDNILIGTKDKNTLSIVRGDLTERTFNLDDPLFNRQEFLDKVMELNPRINITLSALSSVSTIEMLDEADAILTDAALLGTVNAGFSVYNVGVDGKPVIREVAENPASKNSDLRKIEETVFILGQVYRKKRDKWVDAVDKVITDPRMLEQIKYNNIIQSSNLSPVETKGNQEYFIISQDRDNPIAVKRHKGTSVVTTTSKEQSLALIELVANKEKEKRALEALNRGKVETQALDNVLLEEEPLTLDNETTESNTSTDDNSDIIVFDNTAEQNKELIKPKSLVELQEGAFINTLQDVMNDFEAGFRLDEIIDEKISSGKWENVPDDITQLTIYLENKGIPTSGITDINSWLNMIEECK